MKAAKQTKREIHYALNSKNRAIFLVQRARDASLMPGMWELPELAGMNGEGIPWFTLRHSITLTDYTVRVWKNAAPSCLTGRWISLKRVSRVALTGLARKILRRAEVLSRESATH